MLGLHAVSAPAACMGHMQSLLLLHGPQIGGGGFDSFMSSHSKRPIEFGIEVNILYKLKYTPGADIEIF